MEPPPFDAEFDTFESLLAHANSWARSAGYAITIRRRTNRAKDGTYRRVDLCCDRGGSVRESQATGLRPNASSRKRSCPFSIKVNLIDGLWVPTIIDAAHSHDPSLDIASHPSHRKKTWTQEQKQEVCNHFRTTLGSARDITSLMSLKYPDQTWALNDVRNEISQAREESLAGYTPTQVLIRELEARGIRHFYRQHQGHITSILWTLPWCEGMWLKNPEVMIIDCTYKTNRFKLPFLNICGVSNISMTFNIAFAFISKEDEEAYLWALQRLDSVAQELSIKRLHVLVTDFDKALMNAAEEVWVDAHQQICMWHVNKNVEGKVREKWL